VAFEADVFILQALRSTRQSQLMVIQEMISMTWVFGVASIPEPDGCPAGGRGGDVKEKGKREKGKGK